MLPPVILMHMLNSSHSESHSGGETFLVRKSWGIFNRNHGFISTFLLPSGAPPTGPPMGPPSGLEAREASLRRLGALLPVDWGGLGLGSALQGF